jgi:preprotein translocase subunit SecD
MLEYARWKYILVGVVLAVALLFALPNCSVMTTRFRSPAGSQRATRRSSRHRNHAQAGRSGLHARRLDHGAVIVRFADNDSQLKGRDVVKDEKTGLNKTYVNAMMYASRAPRWIQALGLRAMPLGLDLRGGLYLLFQVDVDGAVAKLLTTYDQDLRRALETEKIPFTDITSLQEDSDIPNGLRVLLPAGADLGAVRAAIKKVQPDLGCRDAGWRKAPLVG